MASKMCTGCSLRKALELFRPHRNKCMLCQSIEKQQWDAANTAHVARYNQTYQAAHRVDRLAYNLIHKEEIAERTRTWALMHRESRRMSESLRRALKNGATTEPLPDNLWERLIDFYGDKCMVVGCTNVDLTLDHIIPLSKGGQHSVSNFQILCGSHNSGKGNHHSTDYRPEIRMESI